MEFLKIADPDKPGDHLVIAKHEFDPAIHQVFGAPGQESTSGQAPPPAVQLAAAEVVTMVKATSTLDELQALATQEAAHPNGARATVLKAIDQRRAQLAQG